VPSFHTGEIQKYQQITIHCVLRGNFRNRVEEIGMDIQIRRKCKAPQERLAHGSGGEPLIPAGNPVSGMRPTRSRAGRGRRAVVVRRPGARRGRRFSRRFTVRGLW